MRKSMSILAILFLGLLGTKWAQADTCNGISANLVINCSFGTGNFTGWSGTSTTDLFSGVDQGDPLTTNPTPFDGLPFEAFLGSVQVDDNLSQTLTTVAGQAYSIEFALLNDTNPAATAPNNFSVDFGGTTLFSETNAPADAYTLLTFTGVAMSDSTALSFISENSAGTFELDSVSVSAVPEPDSFILFGSGLVTLAALVRRRLSC